MIRYKDSDIMSTKRYICWIAFLSAMLALAIWFSPAEASSPKSSMYTCEQVRAAVASMGVQELLRQARAHGATRAQIAAGKRCLSQS